MRTQIAKTGYLPAEYIPLAFLTRTPSPYSAGWRWGLLSRKIFSNFIFLILARYLVNGFLRLNNFFIFFWIHYQLVLIILRFLFFFWFSLVSLRSLDWNYFFWILYSLFLIIKFLEYFSRVNINSYLFRLVSALQILRFDSSSLYLFDSSAYYKQTSMLIWVCLCLFWLF